MRQRPGTVFLLATTLAVVPIFLACGGSPSPAPAGTAEAAGTPPAANGAAAEPAAGAEIPEGLAAATFAGGCFWCMEPPFDKLDGVTATISGYAGGAEANPTYQEVSSGGTGHAEVVRVLYDPETISYEDLLEVFWVNVDPLDAGGQFCDRGSQYRTGIFAETAEQREVAEASKAKIEERLGRSVVTPVEPAAPFYPAEEYHQDFYTKNPVRYKLYRSGCGRDRRLAEVWGE